MTGLIEISLKWRSVGDEALHQNAPEMAGRFHWNVPEVGRVASPQWRPVLGLVLLYYGPGATPHPAGVTTSSMKLPLSNSC